jgi:hypothetical protein
MSFVDVLENVLYTFDSHTCFQVYVGVVFSKEPWAVRDDISERKKNDVVADVFKFEI